jgi:hypothetical protein
LKQTESLSAGEITDKNLCYVLIFGYFGFKGVPVGNGKANAGKGV